MRRVMLKKVEREPEDPAAYAIHSVIDAAADFAKAISEASDLGRIYYLRRELRSAIEILTHVEDAAGQKMDRLER